MIMKRITDRANQLLVLQKITYSLKRKGYFLTKTEDGKSVYSRLGEFSFDGDGIYRAKNGNTVQGYILNDKGEIMQGIKSVSSDLYQNTALKGEHLIFRPPQSKCGLTPITVNIWANMTNLKSKVTEQFAV